MPSNHSRQFKILLTAGLLLFTRRRCAADSVPRPPLTARHALPGTSRSRPCRPAQSFAYFLDFLRHARRPRTRPRRSRLRFPVCGFLSDIFLRLIKVIVAPLILGTLITGIAGHGDLRKVGRIGWKSLVYFETVTTIALFLGVFAINLTRAGEGLVIPAGTSLTTRAGYRSADNGLISSCTSFRKISSSPSPKIRFCKSRSSRLFLPSLSPASPETLQKPILNFAESLTQVMFRFTNIVMYYAPVGVGAAMAYTVGHMGIAVLLPLGKLLLTAYGALIAFLLLRTASRCAPRARAHQTLFLAPSLNPPPSHSPPAHPKPLSLAPWSAWKLSASHAASWHSLFPPATASISTVPRCISRSPPFSWRRLRAFTCPGRNNC